MILIVPLLVAMLGFLVAFYTFLVERKVKKTPQYKPACDINSWISCSKPIKSDYGNIFYISNSLAGMLFYVFVAIVAIKALPKVLLIASIGACIASAYLAYLLYFKIKSLCLLCTTLYLINIILLVVSITLL